MARTSVAQSAQVTEGALFTVKLPGHSLALTRVAGAVQAFENRCPHLGLPLTRSKLVDGAVTCPFHGSRFDICSGRNLDWVNAIAGMPLPKWSHSLLSFGKQPAPLKTFPASEEGDAVYVELP
jgi:nitrite reductase/ring-hydroxylating ferredoxin subunit